MTPLFDTVRDQSERGSMHGDVKVSVSNGVTASGVIDCVTGFDSFDGNDDLVEWRAGHILIMDKY